MTKRWLPKWCRRTPVDDGPAVELPDIAEAQAARRKSCADRRDAEELSREYRSVVARLRQIREENHFAADIARALRGS